MIIEKDLSGKTLSEKITYYAANRQALNDMAIKARRFGNPDAAKNIVDDCYRLVDLSNR
jgi:UDP-N-acetylglucosamine:LPS N-acetylglucosamine transferase